MAVCLLGVTGCGVGDNLAGENPIDAGPIDPDAPPDTPSEIPETTITAQPPALTNQPSRFEFASSIAGSTFRCTLDGGTEAPCSSPFERAVGDGPHVLEIYAISPAGARDASPARATWTVDTTPPTTTLVVAPQAHDNSVNASFQFESESSVTFACSIDGAPFAACASPYQTPALLDGGHTFEVRATDVAGNVEAQPRGHAWTIDSSTPDTTIDSGPSDATTATQATFTFSSPDAGAGAAFTCAHDNLAAAPCVSPWTVDALDDGVHTVRIAVRDAAGNVDPSPATRTWRVDTISPTTTLVVAPPAQDNSVSARFQFESESGATFACSLDGAPFASCASPYLTPALLDGDHAFEVRATDLAGNVETQPRRHVWTIDSSTPDTTIDSGPSAPTSATHATFTFSSADAGAGASFTCARDDLAAAPCVSPWTVDTLADGVHNVRIAVRDAAGNVDPSPATRTWRVDTTPPTVQITSGPDGPTSDATPSFNFVRSDGLNPVTTECRIVGSGATDFAPCAQHYTAATIPDGDATFVVRARDQVGLETTVERTFHVDTLDPVITITAAPDDIITTSQAGLTFSVTGATTIECAFTGRGWEPCTDTYQVAVLADGQYTLRVRARDDAGNDAQASRWFRRDTEAPAITIEGPTSTANPQPVFDIDIVDLGSRVTSTCQLDDLPVITPCWAFIAPTLADGQHLLTATAVDEAGHVSTATHAFTIDTRQLNVTFTSVPPAVSSNARPTISFTVIGAVAILRCRADDQPWQDCGSPWTVPTPLADGQHNISVLVYNGYNAALTSTTAYFVVDSSHE